MGDTHLETARRWYAEELAEQPTDCVCYEQHIASLAALLAAAEKRGVEGALAIESEPLLTVNRVREMLDACAARGTGEPWTTPVKVLLKSYLMERKFLRIVDREEAFMRMTEIPRLRMELRERDRTIRTLQREVARLRGDGERLFDLARARNFAIESCAAFVDTWWGGPAGDPIALRLRMVAAELRGMKTPQDGRKT